jgi:hypothetical protein
MIRIKINLAKIDQTAVFEGKNGARYIDLTLMENKQGLDQYGNSHMCVQDLGKERRLAGEKGPILGNGKTIGTVKPSRPAPPDDRGESTTVWNRPPAGGASGVNAPGGETEDIPFAPWTL